MCRDRLSDLEKGTSLIEVIVGMAIMLLMFTTLFESVRGLIALGERNRLRANALLLANEHLEKLRALPYDSIGTVAGLPSGTIPQTETVLHDGHTFTRRTFIQYVDDPADGTGGADTLAADYKRIKVELSYDYAGLTQTFSMVTTAAPKSQESLVGAGILRIIVNNANNDPLGLAAVHVRNLSVATTVDITTFTNASGTVSFPGAWAGVGYEVTVTKSGYSSAQTYTSTTTNPNPSPSPLTVAENSTTEIYFKIDRLSSIDLYARRWPTRGELRDPFTDASHLSAQTDTKVTSGTLTLQGSPGTYAPMGTAVSIPATPAPLGSWVLFSASSTIPAECAVRYTFEYDSGGGVFVAIPDSELPGNAAGLVTTPVYLGDLSTTTYSSIRIVAHLESTNPLFSPTIHEWGISHLEPDVSYTGVNIAMHGAKIIGADTGGNPLYKYDQTHTTDLSGKVSLTGMEFDEYVMVPVALTVAEACPQLPIVLEPNVDYEQTLTLEPSSTHAYKATVLDPGGTPVPFAEIRIEGGTTNMTRVTGPCGVAYFPGLAAQTYTLTVQAAGYADKIVSRTVDGITQGAITIGI